MRSIADQVRHGVRRREMHGVRWELKGKDSTTVVLPVTPVSAPAPMTDIRCVRSCEGDGRRQDGIHRERSAAVNEGLDLAAGSDLRDAVVVAWPGLDLDVLAEAQRQEVGLHG